MAEVHKYKFPRNLQKNSQSNSEFNKVVEQNINTGKFMHLHILTTY